MKYPFDYIVITFPDEQSAQLADIGPIQTILRPYMESIYSTNNTTNNDANKSNCPIIRTTCDPYRTKVGSGGGTLAALSEIQQQQNVVDNDSNNKSSSSSSSILILHAGGESSRCPTQMVLGKAWTTLPIIQNKNKKERKNNNNNNNTTTTSTMTTPIEIWLFDIIPKLFQTTNNPTEDGSSSSSSSSSSSLPAGSIVVIASDTLLQIPAAASFSLSSFVQQQQQQQQQQLPNNTNDDAVVIGLAVPAPLSTATNHGVFIVRNNKNKNQKKKNDSTTATTTTTADSNHIVTCYEVLQKPSIDILQQNHNYHFIMNHNNNNNNNNDHRTDDEQQQQNQNQKQTWIDTGVIIFLPQAAARLKELIQFIPSCTRTGLQQMYNDSIMITSTNTATNIDATTNNNHTEQSSSSSSSSSITEFAKQHTVSIDLYTHILQALAFQSKDDDNNDNDNNTDEQKQKQKQQQELYVLKNSTTTTTTTTNTNTTNNKSLLPKDIALLLFQQLHQCTLYCWTIQNGQFVHLGTTNELHQFLLQQQPKPSSISTISSSIKTTQLPFVLDDDKKDDDHYKKLVYYEFGQQIQLTKRFNAITLLKNNNDDDDNNNNNVVIDPSAVIYHSVLINNSNDNDTNHGFPNSYIGANTVIEHCYINYNNNNKKKATSIQIGTNCFLSGLRMKQQQQQRSNKEDDVADDDNPAVLHIPDNTIVQMIPIRSETIDNFDNTTCGNSNNSNSKTYPMVLVVLGMSDNIKSTSMNDTSIYGISVDEFLQYTGLTISDLWDDNDDDNDKQNEVSKNNSNKSFTKTIWNAKLHPILLPDQEEEEEYFTYLFSWLHDIVGKQKELDNININDNNKNRLSLEKWKQSKRLSLSDIRLLSDPHQEFEYREQLLAKQYIPQAIQFHRDNIIETVNNRTNTSVDLQYIVESLCFAYNNNNHGDNDDGTNNHLRYSKKLIVADEIIAILNIFDSQIFRPNMRNGYHDICGRISYIVSDFFMDLSKQSLAMLLMMMSYDEETVPTNCNYNQEEAGEVLVKLNDTFTSVLDQLREGERNNIAVEALQDLYDQHIARPRDEFIQNLSIKTAPAVFEALAGIMGHLAQIMTETHVSRFQERDLSSFIAGIDSIDSDPILNQWILASAPSRVDLAGGWSDTPPICYEYGATVVGLAVLIDGVRPLAARCRLLEGRTGILFKAESRNINTGELLSEVATEVTSLADLKSYRIPTSDCALHKCVLVQLGLTRGAEILEDKVDLQLLLNKFCRSKNNVRLELVSTSLLPHGSGLGTSSILAGCLIAAVGKCIGIDETRLPSREIFLDSIINSVVHVEQMLTSGGGFQDPLNGLVGGIKCSSMVAGRRSLQVEMERIDIDPSFEQKLNESLILVYTGQTRLAKNILVNCMRRWSKRSWEVCQTVTTLIDGAKSCKDHISVGDMNGVGKCLTEYWDLKKKMAGYNSGVEPDAVRELLNLLDHKMKVVRGASLCGAGGGGFMVVLAVDGVTTTHLQELIANDKQLIDTSQFTWHDCKVSETGLNIKVLESGKQNDFDFDLAWLRD